LLNNNERTTGDEAVTFSYKLQQPNNNDDDDDDHICGSAG
jgi:hypothetical protein